jgi:hypothetical protein
MDAVSKRHFIGIDGFLSRLEKVRKTGENKWIACCPAHDDRSPSLQVSEAEDGKILIKDFGQQCDIGQIAASVGLNVSDLFPDNTRNQHYKLTNRARFDAVHILQCLSLDLTFVYMCAKHIAGGEALIESDQQELLSAAHRINRALAAGGYGQ